MVASPLIGVASKYYVNKAQIANIALWSHSYNLEEHC